MRSVRRSSFLWFAGLTALAVGLYPGPAQAAASSDLSLWVGVYPIDEYRIAILDPSGASLILADGRQLCYRLNGIAKSAGENKVDLHYESDALGCLDESGFKKGELLLSIGRASKAYVVRWKALSPGPIFKDGEITKIVSGTAYREDQGISVDGNKLKGPIWGQAFFNRVSPGGICGYDIQYITFYDTNPQATAKVNSTLRAAAGVPSVEEMNKCDEKHKGKPRTEKGPRYCKAVNEQLWVDGDRIGSVQVSQSESVPCTRIPTQETTFGERGLTFDLETGRFFNYSDLFRPESRDEVDKLIFGFLAGKMKGAGIDYSWNQFLKDKKETYEFCLWSKTYDRWVVTIKILDFPNEWFSARVRLLSSRLEPELPVDQLKAYANPEGPLAPLVPRK